MYYKFQRVHGALLNLSTRTETILYATEHVASEEAKWGMEWSGDSVSETLSLWVSESLGLCFSQSSLSPQNLPRMSPARGAFRTGRKTCEQTKAASGGSESTTMERARVR